MKNKKQYTPASKLKNVREMLLEMFVEIYQARYVSYRIFLRDLRAKYRQTIFGYLWAFVPSIVVAYGLVAAANAKVLAVGNTDLPYPAYVMLSMVLWQTFLEAFNAPLAAITESRSMLAKINFPRESLILAKLLEVFFNFFIKLILVATLYVVYDMPITWKAILAFPAVFELIMLGAFMGLFIAPFGAIYQDVSKAIAVISVAWFFITPVIYPLPSTGRFASIVSLNPVTPILEVIRNLATTGIVSSYEPFIFVSICTVFGLIFSWIIFRLSLPYIVERMPS